MTDPTIALKQYLSNTGMEGDAGLLREAVRMLSQMLVELEKVFR